MPTRRGAADVVRDRGAEEVQRHVAALVQRLAEDEDRGVRSSAAGALGETGHEDAVQPLIRRLTEDEDWIVREVAAGALGEIGGVEAQKALRQALEQETDGRVRTAIETALRQIEEREGEESNGETGPEAPEDAEPEK